MGIKKWTENAEKLATEYPEKIGPVCHSEPWSSWDETAAAIDTSTYTFSLTKWPTTHLYIFKKMYISIKPAVHLSTWHIYPLTYHHYFSI